MKKEAEMAKRTTYPFLNLKEAIERVSELRQRLGNGPFKIAAALDALGYKGPSGASNRTFASLNHYGLLVKRGAGYEITLRATRIVRPTDETDKNEAIKEAAQEPKLFSELLTIFGGESVPSMLDNYLIHNFEMTDSAAKKAAIVFKKTMKFSGILSSDGVLAPDLQASSASEDEKEDQGEQPAQTSKHITETVYQANSDMKTLPSGISLSFPRELDFAVLTGEFGPEITAIESKAQKILSNNSVVRHEEGRAPEA